MNLGIYLNITHETSIKENNDSTINTLAFYSDTPHVWEVPMLQSWAPWTAWRCKKYKPLGRYEILRSYDLSGVSGSSRTIYRWICRLRSALHRQVRVDSMEEVNETNEGVLLQRPGVSSQHGQTGTRSLTDLSQTRILSANRHPPTRYSVYLVIQRRPRDYLPVSNTCNLHSVSPLTPSI